MLSATIPNYMDFAKWVGRIKNTTVTLLFYSRFIFKIQHIELYL